MKFIRRGSGMHLTIGKKRKKKRIWRRPNGRDNKMRHKRKGRPVVVSIGYKRKRKGKSIFVVHNKNDLENAKKWDLVIIGKVGKKNKVEILKKASEMKIHFQNVNIEKYLKQNGPK